MSVICNPNTFVSGQKRPFPRGFALKKTILGTSSVSTRALNTTPSHL